MKKVLGPAKVKLGPTLPIEGAWLWGAYCALDAKRDRNFGMGAITYTEMRSYSEIFGFRWKPPEVAIIDALDIAYRSFAATAKPKPGEGPTS
ncbi:MAG: hypothetical protein KJZ75_11165 [Hyphomonadaceae bacterium]|nr:hypothetical protein [Hyphomonadaceae bacterium]